MARLKVRYTKKTPPHDVIDESGSDFSRTLSFCHVQSRGGPDGGAESTDARPTREEETHPRKKYERRPRNANGLSSNKAAGARLASALTFACCCGTVSFEPSRGLGTGRACSPRTLGHTTTLSLAYYCRLVDVDPAKTARHSAGLTAPMPAARLSLDDARLPEPDGRASRRLRPPHSLCYLSLSFARFSLSLPPHFALLSLFPDALGYKRNSGAHVTWSVPTNRYSPLALRA
ncbi:hypothetical protein HPB51_009967 [Rhipicephalus microplus]|uniref:Uncharacterized protein n=1 Tax=Rhipicephalus microplus TaxID=6941 RepID=A0A9J6ET80_RHIMP|nr:hypothetical protein HPB51_009967 [Rhipicephalus microplus]